MKASDFDRLIDARDEKRARDGERFVRHGDLLLTLYFLTGLLVGVALMWGLR